METAQLIDREATRRAFLRRAATAGFGVWLADAYAPRQVRSREKGAGAWTAKDIASRLGISMAVYQKVRLGARQIAAIRRAGITRIELLLMPETFDHRNRGQVSEVLRECRNQGISIVSVHGNLRLPYQTEADQRREEVIRQSLDEIRFAEQAGASIFVAHFGRSQRSKEMVLRLLEKTDGLRIRLTVESMGGPLEPYAAFVDAIGSQRFGLTVDIGHPRDADGVNPFVKPGRARQAMTACAGRVIHLHLHETFDLKSKPDHRAPLHPDGIIEWGELFAALRDIDYRGVFMFEDGRGENLQEWIQMTADFPQAFVDRYGG